MWKSWILLRCRADYLKIKNAWFHGEDLYFTTTGGKYKVTYSSIKKVTDIKSMRNLRKRFPGRIY